MDLNVFCPDKETLLAKARWLAGFKLEEIAELLGVTVPFNLQKDKGWVGQLIETALGATAGSKAEQDFQHLQIELKTIPVNSKNEPLETTFVSLAPLHSNFGLTWENSHCFHKLQQVLWIPIEGERNIVLKERKIGQPILWQPNEIQIKQLKQDWEELMQLIVLGNFNKINATIGEVLQLRPKGANKNSRTIAFNNKGEQIETLPLGFYLRKNFTRQILQDFLR